MLFPYKRIPHAMDKMHEFVEFIFLEVWCKAPGTEYGLVLFKANPSLFKIVEELFRRDAADKLKGAALFFYEGINGIFNDFKQLTAGEIDQYKNQFELNNKIEGLCRNHNGVNPSRYDSLNAAKPELNERIYSFFHGLYSSGFFDREFVKDEVKSTIGDYYRDFVSHENGNDNDVCPFCGILPIDGEYDPTRDAFDHYLPKGKYPFNSVNLANLCPSCNKCNSGNKLKQDPLHDTAGNRRKAFYPFGDDEPDVTVTVTVTENNWNAPRPENINVTLQSQSYPDETATWNELFRIKKRYAAKCCSKNGGIYWRNKILDESQNYECTPEQMFEGEIKTAKGSRWAAANFLKAAFLTGCHDAGLFT